MKTALVVVDVQIDFCEGGNLGVDGGNDVAERIAEHIWHNHADYDEVVFTKDWHQAPPSDNGGHFALPPAKPDFIDTWPVHCVQDTEGAEFHPAIKAVRNEILTGPVFRKGDGKPDYSGFQGFSRRSKVSLDDYLIGKDVSHLEVVGIAGDYCVRETALDGLRLDYDVSLIPEMIASVTGDKGLIKTYDIMVHQLQNRR